jgi:hypothetical protein
MLWGYKTIKFISFIFPEFKKRTSLLNLTHSYLGYLVLKDF